MLLGGCASGVQLMRKINFGMTPNEVDRIMGNRDDFNTIEKNGDTFTLYKYTNRFCNSHVDVKEKCDFFVVFKNDKVIETGVKNVGANRPSMEYTNMKYIYLFQN
jgi:hypothetical protein